MSIAEAVLEKLNTLPPEKQKQVLNYVESVSRQVGSSGKTGQPYAFLDIALNAGLKRPSDWSEHLDDYLHGERLNGI